MEILNEWLNRVEENYRRRHLTYRRDDPESVVREFESRSSLSRLFASFDSLKEYQIAKLALESRHKVKS